MITIEGTNKTLEERLNDLKEKKEMKDRFIAIVDEKSTLLHSFYLIDYGDKPHQIQVKDEYLKCKVTEIQYYVKNGEQCISLEID